MTVIKIKEYIRKRIVELGIPKDKDIYDFYRFKEITVTQSNDEKIDELENVYLMLDELESETKEKNEQLPHVNEHLYF